MLRALLLALATATATATLSSERVRERVELDDVVDLCFEYLESNQCQGE
jgi:hypothetical protein